VQEIPTERALERLNAAEGIENKPAFRKAFERRRCLVPVDNFYEWKKTATGKQPYAIALADRGIMALAGLWENWRSPAGEWIRSFAIITTQPNELCAELHNRMPVVLKPQAWPAWLGEQPAPVRDLKAMLAPCPSEDMICWPASQRVGNVKNNDPSLRANERNPCVPASSCPEAIRKPDSPLEGGGFELSVPRERGC
jgi:putative SOS response-associated peptidase YedK